jgi:hypothetical protein
MQSGSTFAWNRLVRFKHLSTLAEEHISWPGDHARLLWQLLMLDLGGGKNLVLSDHLAADYLIRDVA